MAPLDATAGTPGQRALTDRLLAAFLPPAVAASMAGEVGGDLAAAVEHLRSRVGTDDVALAAVLVEDLGLAPSAVAEVLAPASAPVEGAAPAGSRFATARLAVRVAWAAIAVVVVLAAVQTRGAVRTCADAVCVDAVLLVLDGGGTVAVDDHRSSAGGQVIGVRFVHRTPASHRVVVHWAVDGDEAFAQPLLLTSSASVADIEWPGGTLPPATHVVRLLDGTDTDVEHASVTFDVGATSPAP